MGRVTRILGAAVLSAGVLAGVQAVAEEAPPENPRHADLLRLQEWVLIDRSFHPRTARQALMKLEGMRRDTGQTLSDAEFYLVAAEIAGLADNGHSNLSQSAIYSDFGIAPLGAYWFDDGLYIVRASPEFRQLLGGRILSVEGLSPDELLDKIDPYHGGTREFLKAYYALPYFLSLPLLEAMGVVTDGAITLTVVDPRGETQSVDLVEDAMRTDIQRIRAWQQLAPGGGEGEAWALMSPPGDAPLWLQDPSKLFRYERLDGDIAYIQFRSNYTVGDQNVTRFVEEVEAKLKEDPPNAIILDNRANPGGDLTRTAAFSLALPQLLADEGRIYSLTSNATFSAGIYNALTPKSAAPEKTVLVGALVGDRSAFWAETWKGFQLPQSGWFLNYSLQKHDVGEGCDDPLICHLAGRGDMNIAVGSIKPEYEVAYLYADFVAGRDPVLEEVLAFISK